MVEVIVKYNGNIFIIKNDLDVIIEILSSNYAILTLNPSDINKLLSYRQIEYIEEPKELRFMVSKNLSSVCVKKTRNINTDLTGKNTLIGIIDSGINYTHKEFLNSDGKTKILYILEQSNTINLKNDLDILYTRDDINKALATDNPYSIVPHMDNVGHGTAVCSVACGNTGVAPNADIIVVKLGKSGVARNTEIMRAIKFVLDTAIQQNKPVAINISYGTNDGSHTGTSLFETYINDMSNIYKCNIVVASGNEGNTSKHYSGVLLQDEVIESEISINTNINKLEINLFKNFVDEFSYKIILPNGDTTGFFNEFDYNFSLQNENINVIFDVPKPYTIQNGVYFEIFAKNNSITKGILKILIKGVKIVDGKFNMWLPVSETVSKDIKFLDATINTTLTLPSCANNVITVGGYNDNLNSLSSFSGRGFIVGQNIKPDIVAPANNIEVASNTVGYNTLSGTSIASPFVTGAISLLFEWGIVQKNDLFLYGQKVKAFLQKGATRDRNIKYPNKEWGYGTLCVSNTVKELSKYQKNITISNNNNDSYIYSNEYIPFFAQYNDATIEYIEKYDFIKLCNIIDNFAILYIKSSELNRITNKERERMSLELGFILGIMDTEPLDDSGIIKILNNKALNLSGQDVLIGIVDTGINYNAKTFLYEDGTSKIASIWDQSIDGSPPTGECFGTEYTNEDINNSISSGDLLKTNDLIGHGTKLASICAGKIDEKNDFTGVSPNSELIIVKLKEINEPQRKTAFIKDDIPAFNSIDLTLGINYLYKKARELKKPISICIGLGTNDGAHNGASSFENYLNQIAAKNGVSISVCNGNEGIMQKHASLIIKEVEVLEIVELNVGEDEDGFTLTIINYPADKIGLEIISPIGESTSRVPPRIEYDEDIFLPLSNTVINITYDKDIYGSSGQVSLVTFKNPIAGVWQIKIYAEVLLIGDTHMWLPISNFLSKETYFLKADPFYTVTTPSTSSKLISIGGYDSFEDSFFVDSGRGPTRAREVKPTISVPSVNISCVDNFGRYSIISGTSAGTAILAGSSALLLEWGIVNGFDTSMNTTSIIGYLIQGASRDDNLIYPNNLYGFGKLNLVDTFKNLF